MLLGTEVWVEGEARGDPDLDESANRDGLERFELKNDL